MMPVSYGNEKLPRVPCPVRDCPGEVFIRRLGGGLKSFGCDGNDHGEATIRPLWAAESEREHRDHVDRMGVLERRMDPVAWVQDRVIEAREAPDEKFVREDMLKIDTLPTYRTGLVGATEGGLFNLQGMTSLAGIASSGKTWFALGSAIQSALDGWDVHYLAAEGADVIKRRVAIGHGGNPPPSFHLETVAPQVTVDDMIDTIEGWVTSERTLLVIDSISSLMGLMGLARGANKWDEQSKLEMFLMQLVALTKGCVSIINISEANALGEAKGRTLFHRSHLGMTFKSVEGSDAKEIYIPKAWEAKTGPLGRARVDADGPGLRLIYDGPNSERHEDLGDF